jgi:hypothetical protein
MKCGVTTEEEIRDDHSRSKQPNWFVIVVMELTILQIQGEYM